jgi:hypothetical protein
MLNAANVRLQASQSQTQVVHSNRTDQVELLPLYAGSPGDSPDERTLWQTRKRQPKAAR